MSYINNSTESVATTIVTGRLSQDPRWLSINVQEKEMPSETKKKTQKRTKQERRERRNKQQWRAVKNSMIF
jgi:hypothetical protein